MKALVFAWNAIRLASSLGIVSKSVLQSVNPQTYTTYCVYSEEEVNPHKVAGKHINMCGDLGCSYYRRITGNRVGGTLGVAASLGVGGSLFWAGVTAPVTGGTSLLAEALFISAVTMITGGGGSALTLAGMTETLNGVENELKLKWENEQKERKISDLQRQLANSKKSLSQAKEKKDEYRKKLGESSSNYCREK